MNNRFLTIPGFEKLTAQQCFDMAARHIMKTQQRCTNAGGACSYQGTGCAASVFIKPEHREEADNSGSWYGVVNDGGAPKNDNYQLIVRLQGAHDHTRGDRDFMEEWKSAMRKVATDFNLDPVELTR